MKTFTMQSPQGRITVRVRHIAVVEMDGGQLTLRLTTEAGGGTVVGRIDDNASREAHYEALVQAMQEE